MGNAVRGKSSRVVKNLQPEPDGRVLATQAVDSYGAQLHRFLKRRVRRPQDLDDLVQEVYLRLLGVKNAGSVRKPLAYIFGVASHVVSEFNMREGKGCVEFDSSTLDQTLEAQSRSLANRHTDAGGFFERRVSEALGKLPPRYLAVLVLERREGLTHEQIAERLGLSVHTVKKYGVQALARIRASLDR